MFSLIVAVDLRNGIGLNGGIPWDCPEDLKHFKKLTINNVVIMGRKTYESIDKPLPDRVNVVISRSLKSEDLPNTVILVNNPLDAVRYCEKNHKDKTKFVIGGAEIYNWFIKQNLIYDFHITQLFQYYGCDTHLRLNYSKLIHRVDYILQEDPALAKTSDPCYGMYRRTNDEEQNCLDLMREIIQNGNSKLDRTNVGTLSVFGKQLRFNLRNNTFPLMTTRRMFLRGIFAELMLFIRGQTNNQILEDQKINIWRGNTTREFLDARGLQRMPTGDMGASYGFLFRHFGAKYGTCLDNYEGQGVDQLTNVINTIKTNPNDRRMIISLWDPTNLPNCPLPPCLYNYQFYVHNKELHCMMTQRSSDFVVAGGWNIATGSLLTYLIATVCDLTPAELIWNLGDTHVYNNLVEQAKVQIDREPRLYPKLYITKKENITDFEFSDLELINYNPYPSIDLVMNV